MYSDYCVLQILELDYIVLCTKFTAEYANVFHLYPCASGLLGNNSSWEGNYHTFGTLLSHKEREMLKKKTIKMHFRRLQLVTIVIL